MEKLHSELQQTIYSQERPTCLLMFLPGTRSSLEKAGEGFTIKDGKYDISFIQVSENIYFTKSTYNPDVISQVLKKSLGHDKFIFCRFEHGFMAM